MSLEQLRARLDAVDQQLLEVLVQRAAMVREIWCWKEAHGLPRFDGEREEQLKARLLQEGAARGLDPQALGAVLEQVVGHRLD